MEKHSLVSDIDALPPFSMEKHSLVGDIDEVPPFSMEKHSLNIQKCPPFPWKSTV